MDSDRKLQYSNYVNSFLFLKPETLTEKLSTTDI